MPVNTRFSIDLIDPRETQKLHTAFSLMNRVFYPPEKQLPVDAMITRFIQAAQFNEALLFGLTLHESILVGVCMTRSFYDPFAPRPGVEVNNLAIDIEHQKHGFGSRLLEHIVSYYRDRDFGWLRLNVRYINKELKDFYTKRGWTPLCDGYFLDL